MLPECRDFATCICTDGVLCPVRNKKNGVSICKYYSCPDFDFSKCSKYRPLKVGDFVLPAKGKRPAYCGRPFTYAVSENYNARKDLNSHCNTLSCPGCGILSELQHRFALVVILWTYALFSGQFPSWGFASMDFSRGVSVEAIRLFRRNLKDRLERWGVTAGTTIFHPYRIKPEITRAIRKLTGLKGNDDSEAFWNYIRDDHNEGNLNKIADLLNIEINSIYDCLILAPHFHFFIFPGNIRITGKNPKSKKRCKSDEYDIFIQRLSHKVNGKRQWELRSLMDIYKQVTYLYSHVGQLTDNRYGNIHIESRFGALFRWHPDKVVSSSGKLTFEQLIDTRTEVLNLINEGREVKLVYNGELKWEGQENDDTGWIPLTKLRDHFSGGRQALHAYLKEAKAVKPEYADYLQQLIARNNFYHNLKGRDGKNKVPKKWRKLWASPFKVDELPEFLKLEPAGSLLRVWFLEGLPDPPAGFLVVDSHQWEHDGCIIEESPEMPSNSLQKASEINYEELFTSLKSRSMMFGGD